MQAARNLAIFPPPPSSVEEAQRVLRAEAEALSRVAGQLNEIFSHIVNAIYDSDATVVVTGVGKSGLVGQKIAATLASTGTRSHFLHSGEAVHGDLGKVAKGNMVLALSHSGETAELIQILPSIRQLGASIVAITSRHTSRLSMQADWSLCYGSVEEACPIGLAPSTSCVVMMALGDALAFALMQRRGFQDADFERLHPAGTLGRKLQTVDQVMRTGNQLRVTTCDGSVREVFVRVQRPGRRTGAIILVNAEGKLEGLFTDSDLARLLERGDLSALEAPIQQMMTKAPFFVRSGQRMKDALSGIRHRHFSEIPVLDDQDRPMGIIDITDIVDLIPDAA